MATSDHETPTPSLWWVVALVVPFFLNDLLALFVRDYAPWLLLNEFLVKAIPIAFVLYLLLSRSLSIAEIGLGETTLLKVVLWTTLISSACLGINQLFGVQIPDEWQRIRVAAAPIDFDSPLATYHTYVGVWLVALVEETVFRGILWKTLRGLSLRVPTVFLLTSILFGLIHWSLGPVAIVRTATLGAMFMIPLWRDGTVIPSILAHGVVNFVAYW